MHCRRPRLTTKTLIFGRSGLTRAPGDLRALLSGLQMIKPRSPDVSVTSDGKRLALLRREFQTDVYVTNLLTQGTQLSELRRFTLDDRNDWPSAWTPDSKAVLFTSNRDGPNHIFRQAIDATQPDLLVGGNENLGPAQLTPDGSSAMYVVFPSSGKATDNSRLMRVSLRVAHRNLLWKSRELGDMHALDCHRPYAFTAGSITDCRDFSLSDPLKERGKNFRLRRGGPMTGRGAPGAFRLMANIWRVRPRPIRMSIGIRIFELTTERSGTFRYPKCC